MISTVATPIFVFAQTLRPHEQGWLDKLMLEGGLAGASGQSATDILQEYVRRLWQDALRRRQGALPAAGDAEADIVRGELSFDMKRLEMVKWSAVKDLVRHYIAHG